MHPENNRPLMALFEKKNTRTLLHGQTHTKALYIMYFWGRQGVREEDKIARRNLLCVYGGKAGYRRERTVGEIVRVFEKHGRF